MSLFLVSDGHVRAEKAS